MEESEAAEAAAAREREEIEFFFLSDSESDNHFFLRFEEEVEGPGRGRKKKGLAFFCVSLSDIGRHRPPSQRLRSRPFVGTKDCSDVPVAGTDRGPREREEW